VSEMIEGYVVRMNTRLCEIRNKGVEEKFFDDHLILPMSISSSTSDKRQFNAFHNVKNCIECSLIWRLAVK